MELYSTREAAAYLGISEDSLRQYVRHGRITPDHRSTRKYTFTRATLDASGLRPHTWKGTTKEEREKRNAAIGRRWFAGESSVVLSAEYGMSPETICRIARLAEKTHGPWPMAQTGGKGRRRKLSEAA